MPRLQPVDPSQTTGKTKTLLEGVGKALGVIPNMMRTMAEAPPVLEGYLALSGALGKGRLSAKLREQIALAVAEQNACEYCLAAHSLLGAKAGLAADEINYLNRVAETEIDFPKVAALAPSAAL
jgi:AhpD family alkylhydroperoxidase